MANRGAAALSTLLIFAAVLSTEGCGVAVNKNQDSSSREIHRARREAPEKIVDDVQEVKEDVPHEARRLLWHSEDVNVREDNQKKSRTKRDLSWPSSSLDRWSDLLGGLPQPEAEAEAQPEAEPDLSQTQVQAEPGMEELLGQSQLQGQSQSQSEIEDIGQAIQIINGSVVYCQQNCENGGRCSGVNVCECTRGWTGRYCTDYVCETPCVHGSCSGPNTCLCDDGYQGETCEQDECTRECDHGRCTGPDEYTCDEGWEGELCKTAICNPTCANGECVAPNVCECQPGYEGEHCQTAICQFSCENGGFCSEPDVCSCQTGYSGRQCETPVCDPSCLHGGACVAPDTCNCQPGWEGSICDTPTCESECQNGGTCTGPGRCTCPEAFGGPQCQYDLYEVTQASPTLAPDHSGRFCGAFGRQHYFTYDGHFYTFPGTCQYLLSGDCASSTFQVFVRNDPNCTASSPLCKREVRVHMMGLTDDLILHQGHNYEVTKGDVTLSLPSSEEGVKVEKVGDYVRVILEPDFDGKLVRVVVYWDGLTSVYVEVDEDLAGNLCGLCGNFNGDSTDEYRLRDGTSSSSRITFANSWKMTDAEEHCPNVRADTPSSCAAATQQQLLEIFGICNVLIGNEAFASCHGVVNVNPYIEACVADLCSCDYANRQDCQCEALTQYSRACAHRRIELDWRRTDLCYRGCPATMVYTECASSCPRTCRNSQGDYDCDDHCVDGCSCPEGTLWDEGSLRCVVEQECPCTHLGVEYAPGANIPDNCNQAYCVAGHWVRTNSECDATCSIRGDPHITTFDKRSYQFAGVCQYIVAKDFVNGKFTLLADQQPCGDDDTSSCIRSVTLIVGGNTAGRIKLHQHGVLSVGHSDVHIQLPYHNDDVSVRRLSSLFVEVTTSFGLTVQWDGKSRLYTTVTPELKGHTKGLCGTFNDNQNDDFTTRSGVIVANIAEFGNSWKVSADCEDQPVVTSGLQLGPCAINTQRAGYARQHCGLMNGGSFEACNRLLEPAAYMAACEYDVCQCQDGDDCLCSAIAHYARECAQLGAVVNWRTEGNCVEECPQVGQVWQECGSACSSSCRYLSEPDSGCTEDCVAGCNCPPGLYQSESGACVPQEECQCFYKGEVYQPQTSSVLGNEICFCESGVMSCEERTFSENNCTAGMEYFDCEGAAPGQMGKACEETCGNIGMECLAEQCVSGCQCPHGLVRDGNECVLPENCRCEHNGQMHEPGQTISVDCNSCTCRQGVWSCTTKDCAAQCSMFGNSHYTTFDGNSYQFEGTCKYIIAQDYCYNQTGSFRIHAEKTACNGLSGNVCARKVTVTLQQLQIQLEHGKDVHVGPIPGSEVAYTSYKFNIYRSGFFTIVKVENGIDLYWDNATRLYIKAWPNHRGRLCGMCGNFDGNQINDFNTPELDRATTVQDFANSWKASSSCPDVEAPLADYCALHPHRQAWAHRHCNIILSDTFRPCHYKVDPEPYYEACVQDSCSCDSGGDCECFCTAVAAYGDKCNTRDVHIRWRTHELCPTQCEDYNWDPEKCEWHYDPCGTSCPATCEDPYPSTCDLQCMEGCHPKCPNGTVLYNGKCIPPMDCPATTTVLPTTTAFLSTTVSTTLLPTTTTTTTTESIETTTLEVTTAAETTVSESTTVSGTTAVSGTTPGGSGGGTTTAAKTTVGTPTGSPSPTFPTTTETTTVSTTTQSTAPPTTVSTTVSTTTQSTAPPTTVSSTTAEVTTPCEHTEVCYWTSWINSDKPSIQGSGDNETLAHLLQAGISICMHPSMIECRTSAMNPDNMRLIPVEQVDQDVTCDVDQGFLCQAELQNNPFCLDYEVRLYCCSCGGTVPPTSTLSTVVPTTTTVSTTAQPTTAETTTVSTKTPPTTTETTTVSTTAYPTIAESTTPCEYVQEMCEWKEWMNKEYPNPSNPNQNETYANLRDMYDFCETPMGIQCQISGMPMNVPFESVAQEGVTCDMDSGLYCDASQLTGIFQVCYDYEIRVKCCWEECVPPTTVSTTTLTTTSETTTAYVSPTTTKTTTVSTAVPTTTAESISTQPTTVMTPTGSPSPTQPPTTTESTIVSTTTLPTTTESTTVSTTAYPTTTETTTVSTTAYPTTAESTTPCEHVQEMCEWKEWMNKEYPNPSNPNQNETYANLRDSYDFCETPMGIQCQISGMPMNVPFESVAQEGVTCDMDSGLYCDASQLTGIFQVCYDYEIRVKCCWEECVPPNTVSTTTLTTTSETTTAYVSPTTTETTTVSTAVPTTSTETTTVSTAVPTTTTETTTVSTAVPTTTTETTTVSTAVPTTTTETTTVSTTTYPTPAESTTPCEHVQEMCEWKEWMNKEYPNPSNPNQNETYANLRDSYDFCETPMGIQCQISGMPMNVPFESVAQEGVTCDMDSGLYCDASQLTDFVQVCYDYEIRVKCCWKECVPPTTVSTTTLTTTTETTTVSTAVPTTTAESTSTQPTTVMTPTGSPSPTQPPTTTESTTVSTTTPTTKPTTTAETEFTTIPGPTTTEMETTGPTTKVPPITTESTTVSTTAPPTTTESTTVSTTALPTTTESTTVSTTTPTTKPTTTVTTTAETEFTTPPGPTTTELETTGPTTKAPTTTTESTTVSTTTRPTTTESTTVSTTAPPTTTESTTAYVPPSTTESTTAYVPPSTTESTTAYVPPSTTESTTAYVPPTTTETTTVSTTTPPITTESTTVSMTTPPTTTPTSCGYVCNWTDWMNSYNPSTDMQLNDVESLENLHNSFSFCETPMGMECRYAANPNVDFNEHHQPGVTCDVGSGLLCESSMTSEGVCMDYEVRVQCCHVPDSCKTTTQPTTAETTTVSSTALPTTPTTTVTTTTQTTTETTSSTTVMTPTGSPSPTQPPTTESTTISTTALPTTTESTTVSTTTPTTKPTTTVTTTAETEFTTLPGPTTTEMETTGPTTKVLPTTTETTTVSTTAPPTTTETTTVSTTAPPTTTETTTAAVSGTTPGGGGSGGETTTAAKTTSLPTTTETTTVSMTTPPTTTPTSCGYVCNWTDWMNSYNPSTDMQLNDVESLENLHNSFSFCETPMGMECRYAANPNVDFNEHHQPGVTCDVGSGLLCESSMTSEGVCMDYEVRVQCCHVPDSCKTTTQPTTAETTTVSSTALPTTPTTTVTTTTQTTTETTSSTTVMTPTGSPSPTQPPTTESTTISTTALPTTTESTTVSTTTPTTKPTTTVTTTAETEFTTLPGPTTTEMETTGPTTKVPPTTTETTTVSTTAPPTTTETTTVSTTAPPTTTETTTAAVSGTTPGGGGSGGETTTAAKTTSLPTTTETTTVSMTTPPTTTPTSCGYVCNWTDWMNSYNPSTDMQLNDVESLENLHNSFSFCETPMGMECRYAENPNLDFNVYHQPGVTCDVGSGLLCESSMTSEGACMDYEVRVQCCHVPDSCKTTTQPTTAETTTVSTTTPTTTPTTTAETEFTTPPGPTTTEMETTGPTTKVPPITTESTTVSTTTRPTTTESTTVSTTAPPTTTESTTAYVPPTTTESTTVSMTTPPTTTPTSCGYVCNWTDWMNSYNPSTDMQLNDVESLENLHNSFSFCETPMGMECRYAENPDLDFNLYHQPGVTCDVGSGLLCESSMTSERACMDYEVRVQCCHVPDSCKTTTQPTTAETTTVSTTTPTTTPTTTVSTTAETEFTTPPGPTTTEMETTGPTTKVPPTTTETTTVSTTTRPTTTESTTVSTTVPSTAEATTSVSTKGTTSIATPTGSPSPYETTIVFTTPITSTHSTSMPPPTTTTQPTTAQPSTTRLETTRPTTAETEFTTPPGPTTTEMETTGPTTKVPPITTETTTVSTTTRPTTTESTTVSTTALPTTTESTTVSMTTPPTTTPTSCGYVCNWTDWMNSYNPSTDMQLNDVESLENLHNSFSFCERPMGIECRYAANPDLDFNEHHQPGVTCDVGSGLLCESSMTSERVCMDYEVRVQCCHVPDTCKTTEQTTTATPTTTVTTEKPTTTIIPTTSVTTEKLTTSIATTESITTISTTSIETTTEYCQETCVWSEWMNSDYPGVGVPNDNETYAHLRESSLDFCQQPDDIECRLDIAPNADFSVAKQSGVECDVNNGLLCLSKLLPRTAPACYDYAIRVKCCSVPAYCTTMGPTGSPSPTIPTTQETTTTGTTTISTTAPPTTGETTTVSTTTPPTTTETTTVSTTAPPTTTESTTVSTTAQSTTTPFIPPSTTECPDFCVDRTGKIIPVGDTWYEPGDQCQRSLFVCNPCGQISVDPRRCDVVEPPSCANGLQPIDVGECCPEYQCPCECKGYGDPHYFTFDGEYFYFQGEGEFILARDTNVPHDFEVRGYNVQCTVAPITTCTKEIKVIYNGNTIELKTGHQVLVNGSQWSLPFKVGGCKVTQMGFPLKLEIESLHVTVVYDWLSSGFYISVPPSMYSDKTEGLCGPCNNNKTDDCKDREGNIMNDYNNCSCDWKVETPGSPSNSCIPEPKPTATPPTPCNQTPCEVLSDPEGPFGACHDVVDYEFFYQSCRYDTGACYSECQSLGAYAYVCQRMGVCVDWRGRGNNCSFECEEGKVYKACSCVKTCENMDVFNASQCSLAYMETEGCFCPEDMVLHTSSEECISEDTCNGCEDENGMPHAIGDTWIPHEGSCEECTCTGYRKTECNPRVCPTDQTIPKCGVCESQRMVEGSDPCCPTYECVCDLNRVDCPEVVIPTCEQYQYVHHTNPGECRPEYECRCNSSQCPSAPTCEHPKVLDMSEGGCCLEYECVCNACPTPPTPHCSAEEGYILVSSEDVCGCVTESCVCRENTCSPAPECPPNKHLVTVETSCCPHYNCSCNACPTRPTPSCSVGEVPGYVIHETEDDCGCVNSSCICDRSTCPAPPTCGDNKNLVTIETECCPEYRCECKECPEDDTRCRFGEIQTIFMDECCRHTNCTPEPVCVYQNTTHQPGTSWTDPNDNCVECQCLEEIDPETGFHRVSCDDYSQCEVSCPACHTYQERSGECCGECVKTSCCVLDGEDLMEYPAGSNWTSPENSCSRCDCSEMGEQGQVVENCYAISCPQVPTCPTGMEMKNTSSADGCCTIYECVPIGQTTCKLYTKVDYLHVDDCVSLQPVNITSCAGRCASSSMYEGVDLKHTCECCHEVSMAEVSVPMECEGTTTSSMSYTYRQITACDCDTTECEVPTAQP